MSASYHHAKDGQTHGPVSLDKIRELVATGELARTDFVILAGGGRRRSCRANPRAGSATSETARTSARSGSTS